MSIKNMPPSRIIQMDPITAAHSRQGWAWSRYRSGEAPPEVQAGDPDWVSSPFLGEITDPRPGFTTLGVAPDARLIYMAPPEFGGNDSNDGLTKTSPVATVTRVAQLQRNNSSDWVLLDARGDYHDSFQTLFGRDGAGAGDLRLTYTLYNSHLAPGRRPRLFRAGSNYILSNRKFLRFRGIEFYAYKRDPDHPEFDPSASTTAGVIAVGYSEGIDFEDVVFNYFHNTVQEYGGQNPKDWAFRKCIWTGAYSNTSSHADSPRPSNMFISNVLGDFILEDCVLDYGGWNPRVENAGANTKNHNLYYEYRGGITEGNYLARRNIVTRGSYCGLMMRGPALTYDNFLARNGIGTNIGYSQNRLEPGNKPAENSFNVISEAMSMVKGINACSPGAVCSGAVFGFQIPAGEIVPGAVAIAIGNIVSKIGPIDDAWMDRFNELQYRGLHLTGASYAADNVCHDFGPNPDQNVDPNAPDPGRTLSSYYRELNDMPEDNVDYFDDFMTLVRTRAVNCWDARYGANAINNYIRSGYGHQERPAEWDYEGHQD